MQVTINGQTLDYTLEAERVLGQVVAVIEKELNRAQMVVTSLRVGDRELACESEPAWAELPLDQVPRLDITACPLAEVEREQLELLDAWLAQLEESIGSRGDLPGHLLDGFADAAAAARLRLDMSADSAEARALSELEQLIGPASPGAPRRWPEGIRGRALSAAAALRGAAQARLLEIDDPAAALRTAAAALLDSSGDLAEVSLLLQTGQQQKAMDRVRSLAAALQPVLRAVSRLRDPATGAPSELAIDGRPLRDFVADMNVVLKQAVEALTAGDTVLLGDLLEYEVAPRVRSLSALVPRPETS